MSARVRRRGAALVRSAPGTAKFGAGPGTIGCMERKSPMPPEEREEVRKEAVDADEGDEKLDEYDKEVADSFPASDPPAQP